MQKVLGTWSSHTQNYCNKEPRAGKHSTVGSMYKTERYTDDEAFTNENQQTY